MSSSQTSGFGIGLLQAMEKADAQKRTDAALALENSRYADRIARQDKLDAMAAEQHAMSMKKGAAEMAAYEQTKKFGAALAAFRGGNQAPFLGVLKERGVDAGGIVKDSKGAYTLMDSSGKALTSPMSSEQLTGWAYSLAHPEDYAESQFKLGVLKDESRIKTDAQKDVINHRGSVEGNLLDRRANASLRLLREKGAGKKEQDNKLTKYVNDARSWVSKDKRFARLPLDQREDLASAQAFWSLSNSGDINLTTPEIASGALRNARQNLKAAKTPQEQQRWSVRIQQIQGVGSKLGLDLGAPASKADLMIESLLQDEDSDE